MKKTFLDGVEIFTWDVKKYLRAIKMTMIDKVVIIALTGLVLYAFHGWVMAETMLRLALKP